MAEGKGRESWGDRLKGERRAVGEHPVVKEGEVLPLADRWWEAPSSPPPWSQCFEVGGGGRTEWRGAAGGGRAIFLESFVCVGVHTRAECVCVSAG